MAAAIAHESRFNSRQIVIIAICSLIYFLDGLLHTVLGPMAPLIASDLSLQVSELGPIFSANLIGQSIGLVLFPLLTGRLSPAAILALGVGGFGIVQGVSALAQDGTQLIALRLITGIFLGGCLPICLAMVIDTAPPVRRGLASMIMFTGYGSGATLAGVVAAAFSGPGGWRTAMVVMGLGCILVALLAGVGLRRLPVSAAGEGGTADAQEARPRVREIVGRGYLTGTLMLWLLFAAMLTIQYCLSSWLPTMLVKVGRTKDFAALSVTVFSLGGIIAALGVGVLMDRFGRFLTLVSSLAIATALLLATGQVLESASDTALMALLGAGGFFFLGAYGGINVVLGEYYPSALRAAGIGWTKTVGRIGTIFAPVLIGFALAAGMAETAVMSLFAVPCALAALALLGIRRSKTA